MRRTISGATLAAWCVWAATANSALPLVFEPNHGQVDKQVLWLARAPGYTLFLTKGEAVLAFRHPEGQAGEAVRMRLAGSRPWRMDDGLEPTGGISNYFLGNDPKGWRTDVPHYRRVKFEGVYQGVDLVFYGNPQQLEYDLVVQAGADPKQIRLAYEGVKRIEVDRDGDLVLTSHAGLELRQRRPRVYQEIEGRKVEVAGVYEILDRRQVAIQVAFYDAGRPLVIDPALVYSTYLGGSADDVGERIAVDGSGCAYVLGSTVSGDFPTQLPYQTRKGDRDLFVSKLSANGNALVYSTYLGGDAWDMAGGIVVDGAGYAYVTGATRSTNYPAQSPFQGTHRGGRWDAIVTKLAPAGNSLAYSTYIGGNADDEGEGLAVDAAGSAYVAGYTNSTDFPTQSPYQAAHRGSGDVFVTKLTPAGNSLSYSTYVGGGDVEWAWSLALDRAGSVYVTGFTTSADFPVVSAFQASYRGESDAFVFKLSPAGDSLLYSTYLGGEGRDDTSGIAVDAAGAAYVVGYTDSTAFPLERPFQADHGGGPLDAFVVKMAPSGGRLIYSTYLGGGGYDAASGVAVDAYGAVHVAGTTDSSDFPTRQALQPSRGPSDAFLSILTAAGDGLAFSTYLGGDSYEAGYGISLDSTGATYVTGSTFSANFPVKLAYQGDQAGTDVFVAKFEPLATPPPGPVITEVANAWNEKPPIADAGWIYIKGANLAETTRTWRDNEIVGGRLPTALDGVSVRINNSDAYVYYISPTQINVQVPSDGVAGAVPVQVVNSAGTSPGFSVNKQTTAPAIFVWPPGTATEGNKYVGSVTTEGQQVVYLGKPGLLQPVGIPTRPARPNETVLLFVTACGPTVPPFPAGQVVTAPIPTLAGAVNVKIGGIPAVAAGNTGYLIFAGECQFNVAIPPNAPDGDLPVEMEIGGVKTQSNIYITVQR